MSATIQTTVFRGELIERGFWLYVWRVTTQEGKDLLYVGRTGDNSSPRATAPYTRMGQHLGYNENQNALRAHLQRRGHKAEECSRFSFVAYGPVYPEIVGHGADRSALMRRHMPFRNNIGAMERCLCDYLKDAGYAVMNDVKWRFVLDADGKEKWRDAIAAFRKEGLPQNLWAELRFS